MSSFARLAAAASAAAAALVPVAARAQAGDASPAGTRNFGWIWIVAAVLVVAALFRMFFVRSNRGAPPRRP